MLRSAVVAIGDELRLGERQDANTCWLAAQLAALGAPMTLSAIVGDDEAAIVEALGAAASQAAVVVTTGGLGPTLDDLTRQALATLLGEPLVEDAEALERLRAVFASRGVAMPEPNRRQALRPISARLLPNARGTAPGLAATLARKGREVRVFCLPGPPREMQPMFEGHVAPALQQLAAGAPVVRTRTLRVFGMGESEVAQRLGPLMRRGVNPSVGTTAHAGFVSCVVRWQGAAAEADAQLARVAGEIQRRLDARLFSDDGRPLEAVVLDLLRSRGQRLVTVESCTGGLVGAQLTSVPGSSEVYLGGWITYANAMKEREVGVQAGTLERHGAVSPQTAQEMARGALAQAPEAAWAVAVTGVAGPGGATPAKPVGLVFISVARRTAAAGVDTCVRRFRFPGEREHVRSCAAATALALLRLWLLEALETPLLWEDRGPNPTDAAQG